MKICFMPRDLDGAGCYRCIFPMAYLGSRGHLCSMPTFVLEDGAGNPVEPLPSPGLLGKIPPGNWIVRFIEESIPDADVYVFQGGSWRWQLDWARKLKDRGGRIVVDMDDDFHRIPGYNPARLDPVSSPDNNRRIATDLLELSDAATFSTEALREFYSRWQPDATVLPNRLHWPMWSEQTPVYESKGWRKFRVGYMGAVDYHGADLETIAPSLRKWLVAHPDVEFVAAGDPRIHDLIGVPEAQRVSTARTWFRNLDLPQITAAFDVGLVPLARNDFNEGKSCLKGMEYAGCGIPCIATPTAEYKRWVDEGVNGFLARYPRDFVGHLDRLVSDPALVARLGAGARASARAAALDQHIQDWEAVYERVCGGVDRELAGTQLAA